MIGEVHGSRLVAESGFPVFATEDVLARRWPAFHDLLVTHTPLRSVLALSLPAEGRGRDGPLARPRPPATP